MRVMLKRDWPGPFRRGGLVFEPGMPVDLTPEQAEAVKDALGPALEYIAVDEQRIEAVVAPPKRQKRKRGT